MHVPTSGEAGSLLRKEAKGDRAEFVGGSHKRRPCRLFIHIQQSMAYIGPYYSCFFAKSILFSCKSTDFVDLNTFLFRKAEKFMIHRQMYFKLTLQLRHGQSAIEDTPIEQLVPAGGGRCRHGLLKALK